MNPSVSIIIPCREISDHARECVKRCKQLDYESFEIILLPDDIHENIEGIKIVSTGSITPGAKRNIGIDNSKGEICAFIDSDAYPRRDWLSSAIKYFNDPWVVAVGGPGLTPKEDGAMQKASGHVLSSFMVGNLSYRYKAEKELESNDIHSCNFVARKTILEQVGGWNEKYWPGEDTLICLAMNKTGKKLIEAPDVVVYHHRHPLFVPHLKQVSRFGLHRGYFVKKFQGNSLRLIYFIPSLFVLFSFASVLTTFINPFLMNAQLLAISLYFILVLIATLLEVRDASLILPVWLGIIMTHVVYGVSFLIGLMNRDHKR